MPGANIYVLFAENISEEQNMSQNNKYGRNF